MFSMIYFHHKSVIFDEMLGQYLSSPECPYQLPSNIESYCLYDDAHLAAHLTQSPHPWAKRLIEKRPYRMLIELHSGIPATRTARLEQQRLLKQVEKDLSEQGIHFLKVTSTSELSKYFRRPGDPLFICYDNHYSAPSFIPLETCTDLFEKYSEKRSITRLYVSPEQYSLCRNQGRKTPLRYQEET
jgi:HD superfamily phosphohydrolase